MGCWRIIKIYFRVIFFVTFIGNLYLRGLKLRLLMYRYTQSIKLYYAMIAWLWFVCLKHQTTATSLMKNNVAASKASQKNTPSLSLIKFHLKWRWRLKDFANKHWQQDFSISLIYWVMWGRLEKENPTLTITLKNDSGLVPPSTSPFPWANNIQKMTEEAKLAGMMTRNPKTTIFFSLTVVRLSKINFDKTTKARYFIRFKNNMVPCKKGFDMFSIFFLIDFSPKKFCECGRIEEISTWRTTSRTSTSCSTTATNIKITTTKTTNKSSENYNKG